jgi:very-short-patch-repair endonuclease
MANRGSYEWRNNVSLGLRDPTYRKNYAPYFCDCGCFEICSFGNRYVWGHNRNRLGAKQTIEAVEKMRTKKTGFHHSKYTKNLMSKARLKYLSDPFTAEKGKIDIRKGFLAQQERYQIGEGIYYDTKPEKEMKVYLDELKLEYKSQFLVRNICHSYVADFYLPLHNIIIEVDGKWSHNYPNGLERDFIRNQELKAAGYQVLRFWENEFDLERIREAIYG